MNPSLLLEMAAGTPAPAFRRALRALPDVGFVHAYGPAETSSTIALLGPDDHRAALESDDPQVRARLGSCGRLLPGIEIEVRVADGPPLPPGEPGLVFRGGNSPATTSARRRPPAAPEE